MFVTKRESRSFLLFFFTYTVFKLPHHTTCRKVADSSALMGKQIRTLLTMPYSTNESIWYKKNKETLVEKEDVFNAKGQTADVIRKKIGVAY